MGVYMHPYIEGTLHIYHVEKRYDIEYWYFIESVSLGPDEKISSKDNPEQAGKY